MLKSLLQLGIAKRNSGTACPFGHHAGSRVVSKQTSTSKAYPQSFKESGADSMIMRGGHGPPNSPEGPDSMKNRGQKE